MSTVGITVFGKEYHLPEGSTVLEALEAAGYRMEHGGGCRAGICGACAVLYRMQGSYEISACLACRTPLREGMCILTLPRPTEEGGRADPGTWEGEGATLRRIFPSLNACMECRACDRVCPQQIRVSEYVRYAREGRLMECAEASFACVMCGLCETRCPMKISPPAIAMLARRIYGTRLSSRSDDLSRRVDAVREGVYDRAMQEMLLAEDGELRQRYAARDFEE